MTKSGDVTWSVLAPILLALTIACLGATKYMVNVEDKWLKDNIKELRTDVRVIQEDVKLILKGR